METYPLYSRTLEEAMALQFRIIDETTKVFPGAEVLTTGEVGIAPEHLEPKTTRRVEDVIARVFHAEDAVLVRGAGTGAIRFALEYALRDNRRILVHTSAIYPTTLVTLRGLSADLVRVDYNNILGLGSALEGRADIGAALVQTTRQAISDSYSLDEVVSVIRRALPGAVVVTDDNYAVFKVRKIGCECGADASCFSSFKLLGPEGVGVVVGVRPVVEAIRKANYSGGSKVQGHEAMEALRGMVYAPVSLAISARVAEEVKARLDGGEVPGVSRTLIANAQSKVLLVEFENDIAERVLRKAESLGAAPYPVGSESKYEFAPMFYRISGTFRKMDPGLERRMIRINPMRSGAGTILRILKGSMEG